MSEAKLGIKQGVKNWRTGEKVKVAYLNFWPAWLEGFQEWLPEWNLEMKGLEGTKRCWKISA